MDTSAGISMGPSATLLCVLNGGNPRVAARAQGYRDLVATPAQPDSETTRHGGACEYARIARGIWIGPRAVARTSRKY